MTTTPPACETSIPPVGHTMDELNQTLHAQAAHLRAQATEIHEKTRDYIQHEPVKSVLVAAATGAALVMLTHWISQRTK